MKQILVIMAAVVLVGCSKDTPEPVSPAEEKVIADPIVEEAIRKLLNKHEGELTEADLGRPISLSLENTDITDDGLKEVTKLDLAGGLDLKGTQITDAGLKDVAKLQKLTVLDLDGTNITDAGLKEVAKLQNLTFLSLGGTIITDAGLKDVAKLQNLTFLSLGGTKVTAAGAAELQKALPNCEIVGP